MFFMEEFYGVAAAIYEAQSLRFATTVVKGVAKDQIEVVRTKTHDVDMSNPDMLAAAFQEYLATLKATVVDQRNALKAAIPIVLGWPQELNIERVGRVLERKFGKLVKGPHVAKGVERDRGINAAHLKYRDIVGQIINGYLVNQGVGAEEFLYQHRGFLNPQRASASAHIDDIVEQVKHSKDERDIRALKARGKDRPVARNELIRLVKILAARNASRTRQVAHNAGGNDHRFILTGLPGHPEMKELEYYNVFHDDNELRQIFAAEFMRILGIRYNVALKCCRDQPSPPFADVVATYLADLMDMYFHGEIRPAAVMVKHADTTD